MQTHASFVGVSNSARFRVGLSLEHSSLILHSRICMLKFVCVVPTAIGVSSRLLHPAFIWHIGSPSALVLLSLFEQYSRSNASPPSNVAASCLQRRQVFGQQPMLGQTMPQNPLLHVKGHGAQGVQAGRSSEMEFVRSTPVLDWAGRSIGCRSFRIGV